MIWLVLCPGSYKANINVSTELHSHLELKICSKLKYLKENSVPYSCRTEASVCQRGATELLQATRIPCHLQYQQ